MSLQSLLGKYKKPGGISGVSGASGADKRPRADDGGADAPRGKRAVQAPSSSSSTKQSRVLTVEGKAKFGFADPSITSEGDLAVIGRRCKTDKVSHHGYYRFYPRFLEHLRSPSVCGGRGMLEIGIDESHSLETWLQYFPKSFIYGIDIGVELDGERHRIFQADQSDREQLKSITEKRIKHEIFFIIDDGSHVPEHQVLSFDYLFDALLQPGGTYIIEDIETSYWTKNGLYGYETRYGYKHGKSCIEAFKELADDVNWEFMTGERRAEHLSSPLGKLISAKTRAEVATVTFGMNCIVLTKKTPEEKELFDERQYRFKKNL